MASSLCALERTLDVVGDWWSLLTVRDADRRDDSLQRVPAELGYRQEHPDSRLKSLVAEGVLEIVPTSDGGAHQKYIITEKGSV